MRQDAGDFAKTPAAAELIALAENDLKESIDLRTHMPKNISEPVIGIRALAGILRVESGMIKDWVDHDDLIHPVTHHHNLLPISNLGNIMQWRLPEALEENSNI